MTDEAVLNRLVDPAAKKRLYQIKLSDVGVTSLRPLQDYYGWWGNVFLPDEIDVYKRQGVNRQDISVAGMVLNTWVAREVDACAIPGYAGHLYLLAGCVIF